ncbi:hypothetical protein QYE76_022641 [Lolium multiflorum]|uniref:AP2/ERF domain-containing protein n=1 Tax=Lolium multiflorum TaxID=4521 RepID=A0AAD8RBV6_LOLMU|nr:hypothetical protein QYE76_022641 [Lolium multiflorum]
MPRLAASSRYCRVSGTGYRGVRARPKGAYYAEIRDGGGRIGLGTYETAHEAARAYDAVAWRLGRPRSSMNFHDVWTRQQAGDLAPPSYITEGGEGDGAGSEEGGPRTTEGGEGDEAGLHRSAAAGPTTIDEDDPRWIDLFSSDPVSGTTPDSSNVEF